MKDLTIDGFTEFTDKKGFITEDPMVSITSGGRIGFNKKAFRDYLSGYKHIKLYYNSEKKVIALQGTNTATPNTYPIKKNKASETGYINSKSFMTFFGIKNLKKKVKGEWDQEAEAFLVQI